MEWIVKIDGKKNQRIRITFQPTLDNVFFYGEARIKNNEWSVFSYERHNIVITLEQLQECMEKVVVEMRRRLREHENLDKAFTVLKEVAFLGDENDDELL